MRKLKKAIWPHKVTIKACNASGAETWLWLKYSPNELFLESWIEND